MHDEKPYSPIGCNIIHDCTEQNSKEQRDLSIPDTSNGQVALIFAVLLEQFIDLC